MTKNYGCSLPSFSWYMSLFWLSILRGETFHSRCLLLVEIHLLIITRSKLTGYSLQICLLLFAEVARCKKPFFTRCESQSLLIAEVALCEKSLLTRCEIRSLLVPEVAPYKESLVTRCKIHSLLAAEVVCCKKSLVTRCKIRFYLLLKAYLLLVAKFARYSLQKLLVVKNHLLLVTKFSCYWLHKNYYWIGARQLKVAATDIKYFARSTFSRRLVLKKNFSLTSSSQLRIRILSREVGYLFWVWIDSEKSRKRQ